MSESFQGASAVLDRGAPMPLWFQLREALLREIRDRGMKTGDRLPTESEIERAYNVSRATIRQALAELEAEGVVRRVQGLGTFVASPKIRHRPQLQSFSELARSQGFVPSHRMLRSELVDLPEDVLELCPPTAGGVEEVNDRADLLQREAEPLAPQDESQAGPVAAVVDPLGAPALG